MERVGQPGEGWEEQYMEKVGQEKDGWSNILRGWDRSSVGGAIYGEGGTGEEWVKQYMTRVGKEKSGRSNMEKVGQPGEDGRSNIWRGWEGQ
jgi:hypothetical protein